MKSSGSQNNKRSFEENSSEKGHHVVKRKLVREEFKIILKFRKEGEHVAVSPIVLSQELRKKDRGRGSGQGSARWKFIFKMKKLRTEK